MQFFADLHVHSRYSRATSSALTLDNIYRWAKLKGLSVVVTGDVTHPGWLAEIRSRLEEEDTGLFRLKDEFAGPVDESLPASVRSSAVRFVLGGEISCIYKAQGRVRKVHLMVYLPSMDSALRFSEELSRRGNISSDGRPILGLDAREVLELVLASSGVMIPAHIWTPWFSVLGSKSGFDSLEDAFGDLLPEIFALETGLSSDPAMNRLLSGLDSFVLVSSSDAHNPQNLAREATVFDTELSWDGIFGALRSRSGYLGTVEFFPEEGKYFLDGHRSCGIRFDPRKDTLPPDGRCPVCGGTLTIGVLHRVLELADRSRPADSSYMSVIPLPEILAEIAGVSSPTPQVMAEYENLVMRLGSELDILSFVPLDAVEDAAGRILATGLGRLREGRVYREPGYDGRYGVISVFEPGELARLTSGASLFGGWYDMPDAPSGTEKSPDVPKSKESAVRRSAGLDDTQEQAMRREGSLAVVAGPGSGKTRTLVERIRHLVQERGVDPQSVCAVTFTRRAARELSERLEGITPGFVGTIHSLAYRLVSRHTGTMPVVADDDQRMEVARAMFGRSAPSMLSRISLAMAHGRSTSETRMFERALGARGLTDMDSIITKAYEILEAQEISSGFQVVLVDEAQDLNRAQFLFLRALAPKEWFLIGDPDQAIYGFRGAESRWMYEFPGIETLTLGSNYRSLRPIVKAACELMGRQVPNSPRGPGPAVELHALPSPRSEGVFVSRTIERLLGGVDFWSLDSGTVHSGSGSMASPGDIAVVYRVEEVGDSIEEMLARRGIPVRRFPRAMVDARIMDFLVRMGQSPSMFQESSAAVLFEVRARFGDDDSLAMDLVHLENLSHLYCDAPTFLQAVLTPDPAADPGDAVTLMTAHASKGLEFPVVFVVGLEEGTLPLYYGGEPPEDDGLGEERRLLYVAMTRARDRLFLSHVARRRILGGVTAKGPSRFLKDMKFLKRASDKKPSRSSPSGGTHGMHSLF